METVDVLSRSIYYKVLMFEEIPGPYTDQQVVVHGVPKTSLNDVVIKQTERLHCISSVKRCPSTII